MCSSLKKMRFLKKLQLFYLHYYVKADDVMKLAKTIKKMRLKELDIYFELPQNMVINLPLKSIINRSRFSNRITLRLLPS